MKKLIQPLNTSSILRLSLTLRTSVNILNVKLFDIIKNIDDAGVIQNISPFVIVFNSQAYSS